MACDRNSDDKLNQLVTHTCIVPGGHSLDMEMMAVIDAMKYARVVVKHPVTIVCDCAYVVNSLLHGWPQRWRRNGWRNSKGKVTPHGPLWRELLDLYEAGGTPVRFQYVRGHGRGDNISNGPYRQGNAWADAACRGRIAEHLTSAENLV